MIDAADTVVSDDERALARFEEEQRLMRIAMSHRKRDPEAPINCVDCSELVPVERLRAYPYTRRCVSCAAEVERIYRRDDPK